MTLLHVRAGLTIDPSAIEGSTAGAHADQVAQRYGVAGASFTYKADGVVLERNQSIPPTAEVLELVELPAPATVDYDYTTGQWVDTQATIETKVTRGRRTREAEADGEAPAQDL